LVLQEEVETKNNYVQMEIIVKENYNWFK
jgi:hypothetical protein